MPLSSPETTPPIQPSSQLPYCIACLGMAPIYSFAYPMSSLMSLVYFSLHQRPHLSVFPRIFFSHPLLVFLRSRTSARIGKRKDPPGREKIATAGIIFTMFLRCLFISFFSSLVHFSFVFRIFIRRCISPFIERTSIRMAFLFVIISLSRYFLIIGKPGNKRWNQAYRFTIPPAYLIGILCPIPKIFTKIDSHSIAII